MNSQSSVSVVVPCYNDGGGVARCIEALQRQSCQAREIIVVDDCSTDDTAALAEAALRRHDTPAGRVIRRKKNGGAGAARATGADSAGGEIVAFIDADCVAPQDWLKTIAARFDAHPECGGVGGGYVHGELKTWQGRLGALEEQYAHDLFATRADDEFLPGGNSAFLKSVWSRNRTWREIYHFQGMGSGEDSVAVHEIKKRAPVRFFADLSVTHNAKENGGYFRRHLNRGFSRTAIIAHGLTDSAESRLVFAAYGGRRLLLSSFFLTLALLAVCLVPFAPPAAAAAAAGFLFLHWWLSRDFFTTVRRLQTGARAPIALGPLPAARYRGMLLLRTICWILGAMKGYGRRVRFSIGRVWNISCSILHFWRPGRISKLFYFVTSKCNARCAFCFNLENVVNWQARKPTELTLDEITRVAKNFKRLPYLTLSGGEPFIRTDLPEVIEAFHVHAKTQWVTIPTNAALTERTLSSTLDILNRCPSMFLTLQISLDSMYEDHDKSRVIPGGFAKLGETLKALAEIRPHYPNLRIQIATCYDTFNLHRIQEIITYCREHFAYDQQMFYLIRDTRVLITDGNNGLVPSYLTLLRHNESREWREHGQDLWSRAVRVLQGLVYRDIVRIKLEHKFLRPCVATQKFATLWDDGQISPCEILEKTNLGNVKDFDYDFYALKAAQRVDDFHRKEIVEKKCNCDWMCAPPINMLYDPHVYLDIVRGLINPGRVDTTLPLPSGPPLPAQK